MSVIKEFILDLNDEILDELKNKTKTDLGRGFAFFIYIIVILVILAVLGYFAFISKGILVLILIILALLIELFCFIGRKLRVKKDAKH